MKHFLFAGAALIFAGCATTTPVTADADTIRSAPTESVRVTVANVEIPVRVATIPLHTSLDQQDSPVRAHIRNLILSTRTP